MRLRMAVVVVFLSLTGFSSVSGQSTPSVGTPAVVSPDCAGADQYVASVQSLGKVLEGDLEAAGINLDDVTSLTAKDFGTASTLMANVGAGFDALTPPPAAVQANADASVVYGTFSQLFLSAQTGGIFAAAAYEDAVNQATADLEQSALLFEQSCNVAFLDHDGDGEPEVGLGGEAPPALGAPPISAVGSGTCEDPFPVGTTVTVDDDWQVTVVSVQPDATDLVLAQNQFNEPPATGEQFFIAQVSATYIGDESGSFNAGVLAALGSSLVAYSSYEDRCGVIPDELPSNEVFPNGTVTGNVCWSVALVDVDALVMYYEPADREDRVFFALEPIGSGGTPMATPIAAR